MNIVIIDGQGGQLGAQLVKRVCEQFPSLNITAIGTNALATAAMLKAGAKNAATGENPVVVACKTADIIIGPVGMVIADSLLGEITGKMSEAIGQANAVRILIPMNKCDNLVAGITSFNTSEIIDDAINKIKNLVDLS